MTQVAKVLEHYTLADAEHTAHSGDVAVCCPFSERHKAGGDRRASCSVNLSSGLFYCFSCHAKGNIYDLVARVEQISTLMAGRQILRIAGPLSRTEPEQGRGPDKRLQLQDAYRWYRELPEIHWRKMPDHYLLDTRHLTYGTLEHFGVKLNMRSAYSIVFPLTEQERFVGFVLRRLDGEQSKYKNNRGFARSRHLVGDLSRGRVLVVEGQIDRMTAWQRGATNVCALMGSAISEAHVVVLCI